VCIIGRFWEIVAVWIRPWVLYFWCAVESSIKKAASFIHGYLFGPITAVLVYLIIGETDK